MAMPMRLIYSPHPWKGIRTSLISLRAKLLIPKVGWSPADPGSLGWASVVCTEKSSCAFTSLKGSSLSSTWEEARESSTCSCVLAGFRADGHRSTPSRGHPLPIPPYDLVLWVDEFLLPTTKASWRGPDQEWVQSPPLPVLPLGPDREGRIWSSGDPEKGLRPTCLLQGCAGYGHQGVPVP